MPLWLVAVAVVVAYHMGHQEATRAWEAATGSLPPSSVAKFPSATVNLIGTPSAAFTWDTVPDPGQGNPTPDYIIRGQRTFQ